MQRLIIWILFLFFIDTIDSAVQKSYTTGIVDVMRRAVRQGLNRFIFPQTSYDSDVFRYSQLSSSGRSLYAGESCRLSPSMCSYDEQCCSARCLCNRWLINNEQRCVRRCF